MRIVFLAISIVMFGLATLNVALPVNSIAAGLLFLAASMFPFERTL